MVMPKPESNPFGPHSTEQMLQSVDENNRERFWWEAVMRFAQAGLPAGSVAAAADELLAAFDARRILGSPRFKFGVRA